MMLLSLRTSWAIVLGTALLGTSGAGADSANGCVPSFVSVDTSHANNYAAGRCGAALGETFVAEQTLISSITVWRPAFLTPLGIGYKLWITEVDSTGRPDVDRPIQEGPVMRFIYGDGIHPIEMKFVLDPPVVLPRPGQYYFAVQDYCGSSSLVLLRDSTNSYPGGHIWKNDITCFEACSYLRAFMLSFPDEDLVFTVEFCGDAPTPVRGRSWGELKIKYR